MVIFYKIINGRTWSCHIKLTKELLNQFEAEPPEASLLVSSLGNIKGIIGMGILY